MLCLGPFVTNNRPAAPNGAPDGWGFADLGSLAQVNPAQLASGTDPDYVLEYLDIGAIEQPGIIGPGRTLRFADAPSRARRMVRKGDLLVSTVRPYLRNFARVRQAPDNLVASTGYAVIRPGHGADGRFLYQHVLSSCFVEHLKTRMIGSNYPAVKAMTYAHTGCLCRRCPSSAKLDRFSVRWTTPSRRRWRSSTRCRSSSAA